MFYNNAVDVSVTSRFNHALKFWAHEVRAGKTVVNDLCRDRLFTRVHTFSSEEQGLCIRDPVKTIVIRAEASDLRPCPIQRSAGRHPPYQQVILRPRIHTGRQGIGCYEHATAPWVVQRRDHKFIQTVGITLESSIEPAIIECQ